MTWLAALGFAHKHWKSVGLLILAASVGLYIAALKGEVRHERKLRTKAETALTQCAQGRAADRKSYVDGQTAARLQHEAAKRADEALHTQIKKDADNALKPQIAAARARLADYARLHPAPGAAEGAASGAYLPRAPGSPGEPYRPGVDPVVAVSLDDANRCTDAVVRLLNAREWALNIQGAGK